MKYAQNTTVGTDKTISEIRNTLNRYGAVGFAFMEDAYSAQIAFEMKGRRVRFKVMMPEPKEYAEVRVSKYRNRQRTPEELKTALDKASKQIYRALLLVVKAKLESVESGIESFDQAFMAHLILPSGQTVTEWMDPQRNQIWLNGKMPPLLAAGD